MHITFVNREKEIKLLGNLFNKKENSFIVVYGRRRVGKTELIKRVTEKYNKIYLFCEEGYKINLKGLERMVKEKYNINLSFNSYKSFFELISKLEKEKMIVVFDEFQNLVENRKILSEFQFIVDEIIKKSKIHFVVLGSSISFMKEILEYKSPLYGRRDLSMELKPLSFFDSIKFYNLSIEEIVKIFGITGGIPLYLKLFKKFEDVKEICFNKYGFLYQEIEFLLSSEFKESRTYKLILSAIAKGKNNFSDISNHIGIPKSNLFIYLENLIKIGLVERIIPINESPKTKKSFYFIKDNYVNFYFSFIEKYKEMIEFEDPSFFNSFLEEYNNYLGFIFEKISKEFILELSKRNKIMKITKIGKWWWRDKEIDLVAFNEQEKTLLAFEVKWKKLKLMDVKRIIRNLENKLEYLDWNNNSRKEFIGVIAKEMDEKAKSWLKENGYLGFELKDFEGL
jgi:AAA+ ATPase superfamily predicted ATPase